MWFGEAAAHLLSQYGIEDVFGIPGVHTVELYRGFGSAGLRTHVARHEQGCGFMADAYARVSGRVGVCAVVTGPGLLNLLTPAAQAWHDSVPILILAASTRSDLAGQARGALHDIPDQAAAAAGAIGWSKVVRSPEAFPELLAEAWGVLTTGRPRPACLHIPIDVLDSQVPGPWTRAPAADRPSLEPSSIDAVRALVAAAERPVIIAGGGSRSAAPEVQRLAERLDAPVLTTGNGSGVIDASHPLAVGTLLPFSGARDLVAAADVVLALGTEFSETDVIYTGIPLPAGGDLVMVDVDPAQLSAHRPRIGVCADVRTFLSALLGVLPEPAGVEPQRAGAQRAERARSRIEWTSDSRRHMPWLDALWSMCPPDLITTLDSTQLAYTAHQYVPRTRSATWLAPYGLGTLGPALPMAVGAGIAAPDRPTLAVCGDGGLLFTLPELATAVDAGRQLLLVVWDNRGYGEIRDSFDRAGVARTDTEVTAFDLVAVAAGFGAHAVRVTTPGDLRDEAQKAFLRKGVSVVVVTADDVLGTD
ncbi:hypothetical protein Kisp01_33650 [Kineosporia sp. NBRC 101677]|uniref:5-guanidino-2-oxopentanoate decarboxylase n=1 Tax=Kineosporia sp. NBRC 101677 TaxID=3032197 RepID=UPI00249FE116|nr:5-guanidino-2-oxopentanoate decarboxylase [Kineosporia sp. NBRC 101677]GLY16350.1 hypothetical protein Kisp01_33650 [Kineosporia sp. NBRC 101677]